MRKIINAAIGVSILSCVLSLSAFAAEEDIMTYDMTGKDPVLTIDADDGDYKVNIITGGDTETNANIFINGGERVREYTLEAGQEQDNEQFAVPEDGVITIEVKGDSPNVKEITVEKLPEREARENPAIYIAGDSTAQTYNYETAFPQTGWGQVIGDYFTGGLTVENRSMGGRSSKSFDNDGRLDKILSEICPGDYLLIQFGINDGAVDKPERYISVEDYKKLISEKYIGEARKRGAIPILLTATAASWWDEENGNFMESRQDYAVPTKEIAEETETLLIDVNKIATEDYNNNRTKDEVFSMYFICEPLESAAYPEGTDDHTHLKEKGARVQAGYIVNELKKIEGLAPYIVTNPAEKFEDIDGHWVEKYIEDYSPLMQLKGISETEFAPDDTITRAQFLKMAMESLGVNAHAYREGECLDANTDDWYRFYLQGALDKGIIPVEMVENCSGTEKEIKTIKEASDGEEAVTAEISAYKSDDGFEMKFDAESPVTREEAAVILYNVAKASGKSADSANSDINYTDIDDISEWAKNAVIAMTERGYFDGYDEGDFRPKGNMTRAEAVKLVSE